MMGVSARLLVAEHVQYLGVMARLDKAIAAIGFDLKFNAFASGIVFYRKLIFDLANGQAGK